MSISGLDHFTINTSNLVATTRFYRDVIGMELSPRPDFGFPGAWMCAEAGGPPIIHIMAFEGWQAKSEDGRDRIDHLALHARDFERTLAQINSFDLPWVGNVIEGFGLWQLMLYDPSGVLIELNFKALDEAGEAPVIPENRKMGGDFIFESEAYEKFQDDI